MARSGRYGVTALADIAATSLVTGPTSLITARGSGMQRQRHTFKSIARRYQGGDFTDCNQEGKILDTACALGSGISVQSKD